MKIPHTLRQKIKPYGFTLGLFGLTLTLSLILIGEWFWLAGSLEDSRPQPATSAEAIETQITLEAHALPDSGSFAETVERPLFMETRRPAPPAAVEPAAKLEPPTPVTFRLMGVIATPKGPVALIADKKGKYHRLRPKEKSEGWEVHEIQPDHLIVEQQGIQEDLSLIKKRPKTAPHGGDGSTPEPDPRTTAAAQPPPTPNGAPPPPPPPAPAAEYPGEGLPMPEEAPMGEDY